MLPHKNGRIDKVKRHETDGILPVCGKKKKESNDESESPTPFLLLTYGEIGEQNEELEASTMERTNSENMHMSNLTASASTTPKTGRRGRKRKMKIVGSSEGEATTPIDVPIIDEAGPIDVPIIDEGALIDVPITYVENFSDLGR
ncbi:hypothetical protein GOBAR_DD05714 [Gossypium barbadense]|nr:hypothetical protein GOBAR_DD05714 [Gossypium barbadense]